MPLTSDHRNNFFGTTSGLNNTTSPVTFTVQFGVGVTQPPTAPFNLDAFATPTIGADPAREILRVTSVANITGSSADFTATRAQQTSKGNVSAIAVAHGALCNVAHVPTGQDWLDIQNRIPVSDVLANLGNSLPSNPANDGLIYLPQDAMNEYVADGTIFRMRGPSWPLRNPTTPVWTASTVAPSIHTTTGGVVNVQNTYDGTHTATWLDTPVPSTPYTITACLLPSFSTSGVQSSLVAGFGLGLADATPNNRSLIFMVSSSAVYLALYQLASQSAALTLAGAVQSNQTFWQSFPIWLRIVDDGTHRTWLYSFDGFYFQQFLQELTGAGLTPTLVTLPVLSNSSAFGSAGLTCISYKQSASAILTGPDF